MALRFEKATKKAKHLKCLFFGDSGTRKTVGALSFPRPAVIDTENGTDLYQDKFMFDVVNANDISAVEELLAFIERDNGKTYDTLVIDSLTVLVDVLRGAMEKKAKNGEMGYREHGAVNRRMKALYGRLMNLPVHVVATAHEAIQYEGAGNSLRKAGVKPDADKSIAYAFDFVINTQRNGKGVVWKGRGSKELEEGKVVSGVTWELFKDIAKSNATGEAVKALNDEEAIANEAARIAAAEDLTAAKNAMIAELVASELFEDVNAIGAAVSVLKKDNPALSFEADPVGFKAALVEYAQGQKAA
ncbi:MAG: AAA family ATPase [Anaerolineae bacterium]|nr:AAA family ATPase [Chloroflexota bacterium]MBP6298074.1 AAA family ATPase [Anaerolineae bacterium]